MLYHARIKQITETDEGKDRLLIQFVGRKGYREWVNMDRVYKNNGANRELKDKLSSSTNKRKREEEEDPNKRQKTL